MAMLKSTQIDKYIPAPSSAKNAATNDAKAKPKSAEMSGGPGFRVRTTIKRPARNLIELFRPYEAADVSDLLNRMFTLASEIRNLANDKPLLGPAITVKLFPGDNLMLHKALDLAEPGDVVVVDTTGSSSNAVFGDLIANKAKHKGIAGFVIDGLIRDIDGVKQVGLPVYARGITAFGPLHRGPGELNYPICCGGVVVNPGDIVSADESGVVIVRREFASELLGRLVSHKAQMESYVAAVKRGEFSNAWVDKQLKQGNCFFE